MNIERSTGSVATLALLLQSLKMQEGLASSQPRRLYLLRVRAWSPAQQRHARGQQRLSGRRQTLPLSPKAAPVSEQQGVCRRGGVPHHAARCRKAG